MPALATPPPPTTQALMTDFLKASSGPGSSLNGSKRANGKARQSLGSATNQTLPSPAAYQAYYPPFEQYGQPSHLSEGYAIPQPYFMVHPAQPQHPMAYAYPPAPYSYQMTPSLSSPSEGPASAQPQQTLSAPPSKPTRKYTKKAASWKENGGEGRKTKASMKAAEAEVLTLATASASMEGSASASASGSGSMSDPFSPTLRASTPPRRRAVPVTSAGPEGRKLDLTAVEDVILDKASLSPTETRSPRLATIPAIQTDQDGLARLATAQVVQSEMGWLESVQEPKTPERAAASGTDASPTSEARATKTKRRLEAFSTTASSSTSPTKKSRSPTASSSSSASALISTRVEKYGRVALGKEAAVRWLGLQGVEAAVEETHAREEVEEEAWVRAQSADGEGSTASPTLVRPDWPDDLAPWSTATEEQRLQTKEHTERKLLLTKYLETESEEEEDVVEHVFGRSTAIKPGRGKTVWALVPSSPTLVTRSTPAWQADPADARSALLLARRKNPVRDLGPQAMFIACRCGSLDDEQSMVSCEGCQTWHHLSCLGVDSPEQLRDWWCLSCEENLAARPATPPPVSREQILVETADPTRIYRSDLESLALAPSPMFGGGGDRLRGLGTPSQKFRTPRIPSMARSRIGLETPGSPSSARRSRVLSYGDELESFTPSTPASSAARNVSGASQQPSTPRFEDLLNAQDDHHFDVTSTPSRHLDFTPGQGYLFSTPAGSRARVVSSTGQPLSFATPSQDFLKDLQHNEATPGLSSHLASAESSAFPLSPFNFGSASAGGAGGGQSLPRLPNLLSSQQHSPSPYGHRRRVSSGKVSFAPASSSVRLSSRLGYGMGMGFDEEDEHEGEITGKRYDGIGIGSLEGSSMR